MKKREIGKQQVRQRDEREKGRRRRERERNKGQRMVCNLDAQILS